MARSRLPIACGLLLLLAAAVAAEQTAPQRYRHPERPHPHGDAPEHYVEHGNEAPARYRQPEHDAHSYAAPAVVRVPCKRDDIFYGTTFMGTQHYPDTTKWILQNQLLVEGISPVVTLFLFNATTPLPGAGVGTSVFGVVNTTGPLSTKAPNWTPLFYLPEDAPCSLGAATAQYQAAHPNGPQLFMNTTVLAGPNNDEPGAWQPQGFFTHVESVKDGRLMFQAQRLYDDGGRRNPIRSVTKALTVATFMALSEEGLIALDDKAGKYVPAFNKGSLAAITFRMLMTHTSGLPVVIDQGAALLDPSLTLMESATFIAENYPLDSPPGTAFAYTEIGFQVVGAALEAVTGASYQSLVRRHITEPLGMDDTQVYNQWKDGYSTNPGCAAGGVASPNDLLVFMRMLAAKGVAPVSPYGQPRRVLSEASVAEILTPQPNTAGVIGLFEDLTDYQAPLLVEAGLLSPAANTVLNTVMVGDMMYGLGVFLTQVKEGKAKNVVVIGGTGQFLVITDFHDPDKAILLGANNFQNDEWGWEVSAVILSYVLAEAAP